VLVYVISKQSYAINFLMNLPLFDNRLGKVKEKLTIPLFMVSTMVKIVAPYLNLLVS